MNRRLEGVRTLRAGTPEAARHGHLAFGDPEGAPDRIEVTSRWLERDGRPWFPVTGEVHYSRIPRERWSEVLGHAAAGGLTSVATYVFWQAHEPEPGAFRWDGNLDLRAFVELAARHGLEVVARIGPWAHGEARHGGFPDWLVESGLATRTNDAAYLARVRLLYAQIAAQLEGLTHADGGPVVGVQIENELYDQPEHLATLREIAEELGLHVPLWTATGWGGAQVPDTLLPVYSAYAEGFWEESGTEWAPFAAFHLRYSDVRDDLTVGADLREALDGIVLDPDAVPLTDDSALPFAMCELGGGMHVAYHRRPLVTARDVDAVGLAKLGSGSIWQGYYMYAGGTQRVGARGTEQESHATGYPNDVPSLTYDFNAPIGEHAQIRPHHHLLRRRHLWLHHDGHRLATMAPVVGGGSDDPAELRWAVRTDGLSGYLFLTTYQPVQRPLPGQPDVQVTVTFDDGEVTVPTVPADLPAGLTTVWPLRYPLADGLLLRSATAEVLTRIADDAGDLVVLAAAEGVPVELVVEGRVPVGGAGRITTSSHDEATVIELTAEPGPACVVELPGVRVIVLDPASANRLYRLDVAGRERLVLADAPVYAEDGGLVLHTEEASCTVSFLPAPASLTADGAEVAAGEDDGPWRRWVLAVPAAGSRAIVAGLVPEAPAPPEPVHGGPLDRLSAPTDFSGAAQVVVDVQAEALAGVDRALLRIRWSGDVGRAFVGDRFVSDHFWHGRPWEVDLTPHAADVVEHGVRLDLLPWRAATGVWVDPSVRGVPDGIVIDAVEVVRVARVRLSPGRASPGTRRRT